MAATVFHQWIGGIQVHNCGTDSSRSLNQKSANSSLRFISRGFVIDYGLLGKGTCISSRCRLRVIRALTSDSSVIDPISSPSHNAIDSSQNTSSELIYIWPTLNFCVLNSRQLVHYVSLDISFLSFEIWIFWNTFWL